MSGGAERVASSARAFARAELRLEQARNERDAAIREAVAGGMKKADVARLAGVSRMRVGQIVEGRR